MNKFIFTKKWKKEFNKLDKKYQNRIINKLSFLKNHENLLLVLKSLENFNPATHRLRIWDIRVILQKINDNEYHVIDLWHRWSIYK